MSITAGQAAADLEPKPKPEKKRDRVARYLVANDRELYVKGARMIDVAGPCGCCTATVRAARAQVEKLSLFWYPRRWPKLPRHPLSLFGSQWIPIRSRLLKYGARLSKNKGAAGYTVGLKTESPDFACRWLSNNHKCAGLTVATVVAAGRSIGWKHW